ncbi:hypothetical protein NX059_002434 [Plenodomus lindquistii]|nr:hypothetical protein NX059_002434 [Plenodomus lindquistii]
MHLARTDGLVLLRAFYLAASLLILVIQAVPALRTRFLAYGSRATTTTTTSDKDRKEPHTAPASSLVLHVLDYAATLQVPHNYFTHFYVLSVACSLFWGLKLRLWDPANSQHIVWALMLLQGVRRMLESYTFTSSSKSTMWFAHWLLGLGFYLSINVAVWIEGPGSRQRDWILVPAVLTAHVLQHSYHAYLYRIRTEGKGYQVPSHPLFSNLLCPHYSCEVAIYALLSVIAAPPHSMVNWTLLCGTVFVATNLGVTAVGTKQWYMNKFGAEKVGPRKRMVPFIW